MNKLIEHPPHGVQRRWWWCFDPTHVMTTNPSASIAPQAYPELGVGAPLAPCGGVYQPHVA